LAAHEIATSCVPRESVYHNLCSLVAPRDRDVVAWNSRFVALRGHYAVHATACTPETPREKGAVEGGVRHLKDRVLAGPADRFPGGSGDAIRRLARPGVQPPPRATGGFWVHERLDVERPALRPLPPITFDNAGRRSTRVPLDGYLKLTGSL
jgi:hypothetical protein